MTGCYSPRRGQGQPLSLGKRLKDLRLAKGLTQTELAEPYYTYSYVSAIESDRRRPSDEALAHFASKLGTDAEELRTGRPRTLLSELELRLAEVRKQLSKGKLAQAEDALREITKAAKKFRLLHLHARATTSTGLLKERQDSYSDAIDLYREAKTLLRKEAPNLSVDALAGEARCLQMLGDVRLAVHLLETMLAALEEGRLNDPGAALRLHATLIGAYFQAGLYDRAYTSAEEALRLAPDVNEPERLANMYLNAAWALNHRGNTKESYEMLLKAEHLFDELELKLELGRARLARGMTLTRTKKLPAARKELERAAEVFEEAGNPLDLARCLNELARVQRLTGKVDDALESLHRSIEMLGSEEHPAQLGWAHRELALTTWSENPKAAEKNLARALELYHRTDEPVELAVTYRYVGDLAAEQGDSQAASQAYREGIVFLEKRT